jgi:hypothetical protein
MQRRELATNGVIDTARRILMKTRLFVLSSALTALCASGALPAQAFTHHPATPEEIQQTDALNAQSLANAQGTGANAANVAAASPSPTTTMPSLSALTAAPPTLGSAAVQSQAGEPVGVVQKVITSADGKVSMVDVALSRTKKIVAISADELSYDEQRNILMASLTVEQINSLPAASS